MKNKLLLVLVLILCLSGCSLVQWLPSTACENVKYERVLNQVHVEADCEI